MVFEASNTCLRNALMSRLNCLNGMWGLVSCPFLSSICAYQRAEVGEGGVGVLRWPVSSAARILQK